MQPFTALISIDEVSGHLADPNWLIVDCRFSLAAPERGERDYRIAHIPGAVYAHLDRDLSGQVDAERTGRHPLPTVERAAEVFSRLGIDEYTQVVAYDDAGGALAAVRVWWMLKWLGHEDAAVLDGGWQAWQEAGLPVQAGVETRPARTFIPNPNPELLVSADEVDAMRQDSSYQLIDVRAPERYRGEVEPIDKAAGHIPGAVNAPYLENLDAEGFFRSPEELREMYSDILDGTPAERSVIYCGSGVTSIHTILALEHAGLGRAKLYPGSWSEWIASGRRPIAQDA